MDPAELVSYVCHVPAHLFSTLTETVTGVTRIHARLMPLAASEQQTIQLYC